MISIHPYDYKQFRGRTRAAEPRIRVSKAPGSLWFFQNPLPALQTPGYHAHWERILPAYAAVQREMVSRQAELLSLGALDRRLSSLPAQFETLLEDQMGLMVDQPDGPTSAQYQRLIGLAPRFAEMCARLAGSGIPETLHHDDFHDGNVFVPGGRYAFSD